jgi:hypothetical protein
MLTLSEWQAKMAAASLQSLGGRPIPRAFCGFRWSIPVYRSFFVDQKSVAEPPKTASETEIFERFLPQHPSRNPLAVHEAPEASP